MKMNKKFKAVEFQMITPKIIDKVNLNYKRMGNKEINNKEVDNKEIDNKEIHNRETDNKQINNEQINDEPINNEQVYDEQIDDKEIRINNKKTSKMKKILIVLGMMLGVLAGIYIGGGVFFTNHFYWETSINNIQVGGKSLDEVKATLEAKSSAYILELQERNEKIEVLQGGQIGLTYTIGDQVQKLKEEEGAWSWPLRGFQTSHLEVQNEINYDKELLKDEVNQLQSLVGENIRKPEDASVIYVDGSYQVIEGDKGNTVNPFILYQVIVEAIKDGDTSINLEENQCYEEPVYPKDSPKLNVLKDELNHYLNATITYDFGDRKEIIDKSLLNTWLGIDNHMQVVINEEAVADYVLNLAKKYDTLGKTREFVTTTGNKVEVVGGDYGWKMNVQDEIGQLLNLIKEGKSATRQPLYTQTALYQGSGDIGKTYVEVNLSKQHLWFYKEGQLVVEGDIVTGNLKRKYDTPQGTYTLDYKRANAILRGPGYASPVKYWMPFNGGIGLHDASWRSSFGGDIYRSNGSHGCVNLPTQVACDIFSNIESGVPIVCYFYTKCD